MKKIFLLMLSAWALYGATPGFLHSYDAGLAKAQKEHRLLMLVVVGRECPWCHRFERTTLENKKVKQAVQPFVKVMLLRHDKMPVFFQTSFVPVVFFINPDTQEALVEMIGYHDSKRFLAKVDEAKQSFTSQ
jgi:thioredoxin-related protein